MTPAASPAQLPTRSEIHDWTTTHLSDAAEGWRAAASASEDVFDQHRRNVASPGGTTWEGDAKDVALNRVTADVGVVDRHSTALREAAGIAEDGVTDVNAAKRDVLAAISDAENDGFNVAEDLTVTDTRDSDESTAAARHTAATEHAEDIRWNAERLVQVDSLAGERLEAKAAELEGIRFDGEAAGRDPTIQLVDNPFKLEPAPGEPKDPHATDPNRSADGTYGPGNSGDGKAAEKAALDARQKDTGIPIERQQVMATHPDAIDPVTGKPQRRYYDGLEPTGNPGEYIGIEVKTNPGALDKKQQEFDAQVSAQSPATATLNGQTIKIVGAEVEYPPEGWVPPSTQPTAGGSASDASNGPIPGSVVDGRAGFGGVTTQGTASAGTVLPDWGTELTPQQMIESDDPFLRVAGQEILRRNAELGIVDPDSMT